MNKDMTEGRGKELPDARRQGGAARFTVSLPRDAFDRGERERHSQGLTRSEFVSRLYRDHLDMVERDRRIARYTAAYELHPEAGDDQWIADHSAALLFTDTDDGGGAGGHLALGIRLPCAHR